MTRKDWILGLYLAAVMLGILALNDYFISGRLEMRLATHPEIISNAISSAERRRAVEAKSSIHRNLATQWPRIANVKAFAVRYDGRRFTSRFVRVADVASEDNLNLVATDYRCGYCKADRQAVTALIQSHPNHDFVFVEAAILGSESIALATNVMWRATNDEQHYYDIHNRQFEDLIQTAANSSDGFERIIVQQKELLDDIGVTSTPTYIVSGIVHIGTLGTSSHFDSQE